MRTLLVLSMVSVLAACGEAPATAGSGAPSGSAAPKKASASAAAAASAKPAPVTASAQPSAAAPAEGKLADLDLSPAGDAFKGLKVQAPEGTKAVSDGAGGAQIVFAGWNVTVNEGTKLFKDQKSGIEFAAKSGEGKVTFASDKPDNLDYTLETKGASGMVKSWGFAFAVDVGGKKYGCSSTGIMDEANVAKAKDICKSLKK